MLRSSPSVDEPGVPQPSQASWNQGGGEPQAISPIDSTAPGPFTSGEFKVATHPESFQTFVDVPATYFESSGHYGSCGIAANNSDFVVAINNALVRFVSPFTEVLSLADLTYACTVAQLYARFRHCPFSSLRCRSTLDVDERRIDRQRLGHGQMRFLQDRGVRPWLITSSLSHCLTLSTVYYFTESEASIYRKQPFQLLLEVQPMLDHSTSSGVSPETRLLTPEPTRLSTAAQTRLLPITSMEGIRRKVRTLQLPPRTRDGSGADKL